MSLVDASERLVALPKDVSLADSASEDVVSCSASVGGAEGLDQLLLGHLRAALDIGLTRSLFELAL